MVVDLKIVAPLLASALAAAALTFSAPSRALGPDAPFTPPLALQSGASAVSADGDGAQPPALAASATLDGLRLRSHPMALIAGHWSRPGDAVHGGRIETISQDGVLIREPDGRSRFLAWNVMPQPQATAPNTVRKTTP